MTDTYTFISLTDGKIGRVNTSTGIFTAIPNDLTNDNPIFFDIAYDGSSLWGITSDSYLYNIDLNTGKRKFIGALGTKLNSLGFDDKGNLYGVGGNGLYSVDTITGKATLKTTFSGINSSGDIKWNGTGFYGTSVSPVADTLYFFTPQGTETKIGAIGFANVFGLSYNNNQLLGYTQNGEQIKINTTTGAGDNPITINGNNGSYIFGADNDFSSSPVFGNSTYYLTNASSWTEAETQAVAMGGHLVVINDAMENQFLVNTFGGLEYLWIGYTDASVESEWKWVNGETSTYVNWATGEPNNYTGIDNTGEDYSFMNFNSPGKWNDTNNTDYNKPYRGIIEVKNNTATLSIDDVSITEGNSGTKNATFTVTRTGTANNTITVNYSTSDGTATAESDYTATSGTLTFATNETTKTIPVSILGDTIIESDETFFVNLSNASNATIPDGQALGTITNDDTILNNITDYAIYEFLAKDTAYKNWSIGDLIDNPNRTEAIDSLDYKVDSIFNQNGFYGIGLISPSNYSPILAIRGTEPTDPKDLWSDINAEGIGLDQYNANLNVIDWLKQYNNADIVGHSLGGALTQLYASTVTDQGGNLGKVITFNSPGITKEFADKFVSGNAQEVKHYITSGDFVSLGGDDFIDGSYTLASFSDFNALNKHLQPILTNQVGYDKPEFPNQKPNNVKLQDFPNVDWLNNDFYTYADPEFWALIIGAKVATETIPILEPYQNIPLNLAFRQTVDSQRVAIGEKLQGIIDEAKFSVDASKNETLKFPNTEFYPLDFFKVKADNLSVTYLNQSEPSFILQGNVSLPYIFDARANFSGNNYIQVKQTGLEVAGKLSVQEIPFLFSGWGIKQAELDFNTAQQTVSGQATISLPSGLDISGGLGFAQGKLDSISLGVDGLNQPIGTTGVFLQEIKGDVDNIVNANDLEFTGKVGLTAGLEINIDVPYWLGDDFSGSLLSLDLTSSINKDRLNGRGQIKLLNGFGSGDGYAELNWNRGFLEGDLDLNIADFIHGSVRFSADSKFDKVTFNGNTQVKVPNVNLSIPTFWGGKAELNFGGQTLGNSNFVLEFTNDNDLSNDFIRASGEVDLGFKKENASIQVYFNGKAEANIGQFQTKIGSWDIAQGTPWFVLNANWDNPNNNVVVQVETPDGRILEESDFASNNISIVSALSSSTTRAVVIQNPTQGIWDINIANTTGLGDVGYSAFRDSVEPTIAITNVTQNANLTDFVINYNAIDPDSQAKVSLYYDTDEVGNDGILIANNIDENDGSGSFSWNTQGLPTGTYYVYGMILDDNHNPVFKYATTPITISENADLEVIQTTSSDSVNIGENLTYTITITNKGTTTSKGIKLLETLAETVTFNSASLTATQTNGNNFTFDLGDLAPGANTILTINVTPTVAGYIDSRSQITSFTYDPNYINSTTSTVTRSIDNSETPPVGNESLLNSPLYRFQNSDRLGTYLFAGEEESKSIRTNYPNFQEEGIAFKVSYELNDNLIRFNRFQTDSGTYLYAGEEESINIRQNYSNFKEEGIAFYALDSNANQGVDIYRFQNTQQPGNYIFVGEAEKNSIIANFPQFQLEGVAFEVMV